MTETRVPNAAFTGCSVADGGTLGPGDLQVGGPFDGYYRVLIQAQPVEFVQPYSGGRVPLGGTVTWAHGDTNDWPIEMSMRAVSRETEYPSVDIDRGPLGEERVPTWQLMLHPIQGETFVWNPARSAININSPDNTMLRYSFAGDLADMGGVVVFRNADLAAYRGGLKHTPDAPNPIYVPGGPFTAYPGCVGGFGFDRYGELREELTPDSGSVDTSAGLVGVTDGYVGDVFYLPSGADDPQTWVFSVWRYSFQSGYQSALRGFNPVPTEYVVHLPGAPTGGASVPAPRRDEMTQWTTLHHAATNRVRSKLFNTLTVWQGDRLHDLEEVGSSANSSIDGGVTFDAVEGETYMIQLGTGDAGSNGAAVLTWGPTP